jgi:hypothetical protein
MYAMPLPAIEREREGEREVDIIEVLADVRGELEPNQATLKTFYLSIFLFDSLAQIFLASENSYSIYAKIRLIPRVLTPPARRHIGRYSSYEQVKYPPPH